MGIYWLSLLFYGLYTLVILLMKPNIPSTVNFKTFEATGNVLEYSLTLLTKFMSSLLLVIISILSIKGVLTINIFSFIVSYLIIKYVILYLIVTYDFEIVSEYDYEKDVSRYTRSGEIIPDILDKSEHVVKRKDVTNTYKKD